MTDAAHPGAGALAPANVRPAILSTLLAALAAACILLLFTSPLIGVAVAIAAVLAGSFLFFDPLLYLVVFLLPLAPMVELEGFPIHDWASFSRLLIFAGVFARRLVDREPIGPWLWKGRFQKWMLLYVMVTIISAAVVNPLEGGAVRSLLRLASYVLFYYAVTAWVNGPEQLRKILMALLVSTIIVCVLAFFQVASGTFGDWFYGLYSNQSDVIPPWTGRVSSVFIGVNFLAGYLIMALPLALACQTWTQELLLRRAAKVCFFLGVITLVLTQSRGAYIAFLAMLWIAFKTVIRSRRARLKFLPGFALAVIIGAGISYAAIQAVSDEGVAGPTARQRFTSLDETTLERLEIYGAAWGMFLDSPVMGIGYGNFRAHFNPMTGDGVTDIWDAHSLYLKILAETGAVGFICFFAMVGSIMMMARRSWKQSSHNMERILAVAVLGGVITVLVQGLVESLTDLPQFGSLLWLVFALLIVANRVESFVPRAFPVSTPTSMA
jgi:putative inorganic carbon (HCO3(-)) transporter